MVGGGGGAAGGGGVQGAHTVSPLMQGSKDISQQY